jgi:hypothetical protein
MVHKAENRISSLERVKTSCLVQETKRESACRGREIVEPVELYCEEAVLICKSRKVNDSIERARETVQQWWDIRSRIREITLAVIAIIAIWGCFRSTAIAALSSAAALLLILLCCEFATKKAEEATLSSHQDEFSCLVNENHRTPSCRTDVAPADADYCQEAVLICRRRGLYDATQSADENLDRWWALRGAMRLLAFVVVSGLAIRFIGTWLVSRINKKRSAAD